MREKCEAVGVEMTGEAALRLIGDDPETMCLVIELMDRMLAKRALRRGPDERENSY